MNYEDAPVSLRTAPPSECYFESFLRLYLLTYFVVLDAPGGSAIVENLNSQEQRLKRGELVLVFCFDVVKLSSLSVYCNTKQLLPLCTTF